MGRPFESTTLVLRRLWFFFMGLRRFLCIAGAYWKKNASRCCGVAALQNGLVTASSVLAMPSSDASFHLKASFQLKLKASLK